MFNSPRQYAYSAGTLLDELPVGPKWIICGGRNGSVQRGLTKMRVWKVLDDMYDSAMQAEYDALAAQGILVDTMFPQVLTIVEGGAKWTDTWAGEWADNRGHVRVTVPIDEALDGVEWNCGHKRNKRMYEAHKDAERLVGFPGGGGTNNMMALCQDRGMPVAEVELNASSYRIRWWPQR